jgi:ADP-ribose pyrophosphatase YjhB (NUDIX family)
MATAVRAIVLEDGNLLAMQRNKYGSTYFTLVGGRINDGETPEQGLVREVFEETGMTVTAARLVFIEEHVAPYNRQLIYLCEVAPHQGIAIQEASEEGEMNKYGANTHQPFWIPSRAFENLPFRTPLLHAAIANALKKGFPKTPMEVKELRPSFKERVKKRLRKHHL